MGIVDNPAGGLSCYWVWVLAVILLPIIAWCCTDPLRDIPGPLLGRWTDGWYMWYLVRGDFERKNVELHNKFGK